jgi:hypothetical protein
MFMPSLWINGQLPVQAYEKRLSNLRQRTLAISDTMILDTISIIPKTLFISGISDTLYHFDFVKAVLYWKQKPPLDSIKISYRVFPFKLNPVAQHLNYDSISKIPFLMPITFQNDYQYGNSKGIFDLEILRQADHSGAKLRSAIARMQ